MDQEITHAKYTYGLKFQWKIDWCSEDGDMQLFACPGMSIFCDKIEEYEKKYYLFMDNKQTLTLKKTNHFIEKPKIKEINWVKKGYQKK